MASRNSEEYLPYHGEQAAEQPRRVTHSVVDFCGDDVFTGWTSGDHRFLPQPLHFPTRETENHQCKCMTCVYNAGVIWDGPPGMIWSVGVSVPGVCSRPTLSLWFSWAGGSM